MHLTYSPFVRKNFELATDYRTVFIRTQTTNRYNCRTRENSKNSLFKHAGCDPRGKNTIILTFEAILRRRSDFPLLFIMSLRSALSVLHKSIRTSLNPTRRFRVEFYWIRSKFKININSTNETAHKIWKKKMVN